MVKIQISQTSAAIINLKAIFRWKTVQIDNIKIQAKRLPCSTMVSITTNTKSKEPLHQDISCIITLLVESSNSANNEKSLGPR